MAQKSKEQEQAPRKPDTPVPESEVVTMGDIQLSDDPDTATDQIAEAMAGQGADVGPSRPATSKFAIGGQEFEIESSLASALQAQQEDFQKQHAELRGLLPKRPEATPEPVSEPVKDPGLGSMIFDDPDRFVDTLLERVDQRIEKRAQIEQGKYTADQGTRDFWNGFYIENDDLRDFDWVVQASLNRHRSELIDLPVSQASTKLAELSRTDILGLVGKFKSETGGKPSRTTVESGRSSGTPTPETKSGEQAEESNVSSISSTLRDRRRMRREKAAS